MMYRGFKQECPNGAVNEDTFKEIYEKFFPHGSKLIRWTGLEVLSPHLFLFNQATPRGKFHDMRFPWSDVTSYAHHVFKAFDVNSTGSISFRVIAQLSRTSTCWFWFWFDIFVLQDMLVSLSTLLHGSLYEKLIWWASDLWNLFSHQENQKIIMIFFLAKTLEGFLGSFQIMGMKGGHQMQFIVIWDAPQCNVYDVKETVHGCKSKITLLGKRFSCYW